MRWTVDPSGHHLRRDGTPTFLLADTAWELFRRATPDEAAHYLRTRARQGFTAVLAVALSEFDGLRVPTVDGLLPFHPGHDGTPDLELPDERYWAHVDAVLAAANAHGLTVGLLPTWGGNWHDDPPVFTPHNAGPYARWIAARYAHRDVIWVLGGDRPVTTDRHRAVVEAFAAGIRDTVGDRHLVTFHPNGHRSSADFLPDAAWLDFDMVQSGHSGWGTPNYQMIEQDRARLPSRPVLDGEPNYESHPVMSVDWTPVPGFHFDDADARRAAYHAVFAGACGHVYGCHEVWQMYDPERAAPVNGARVPWRQAVDLPGAQQMGHLARLLAGLDWPSWTPAQELIPAGRGIVGGHQRAMAHRDRAAALVYAPIGRPVRLDLGRWPNGTWLTRWWDPVAATWHAEADRFTGVAYMAAHPYPNRDGVLLVARDGA